MSLAETEPSLQNSAIPNADGADANNEHAIRTKDLVTSGGNGNVLSSEADLKTAHLYPKRMDDNIPQSGDYHDVTSGESSQPSASANGDILEHQQANGYGLSPVDQSTSDIWQSKSSQDDPGPFNVDSQRQSSQDAPGPFNVDSQIQSSRDAPGPFNVDSQRQSSQDAPGPFNVDGQKQSSQDAPGPFNVDSQTQSSQDAPGPFNVASRPTVEASDKSPAADREESKVLSSGEDDFKHSNQNDGTSNDLEHAWTDDDDVFMVPNTSQHHTVAINTTTRDDRTTSNDSANTASTSAPCQIISSDSNSLYDSHGPELRPRTTPWQQLSIGMIGFGMEVCFATETALMVPILLQLGLPDRFYSVIWFVSPVLGFLLQPIIGSCSDRCSSPWGRRRPFILAMGIGIVVGLSFFLNGEEIGMKLGDTVKDHSVGIIITMVGQIVLDWSADSSDTPARSYTLDVFNPEDLEKSLSYRALLGGLGAGIGYIINGIDWEKNALGKALGSQLRVVYLFGAFFTAVSIILTVCSVKETPLSKKQTVHKPSEQYTAIQNHDRYDANQPKHYNTFDRSGRSSRSSVGGESTDLEWDNSFDFHHFDLSLPEIAAYHGHMHVQFDDEDVQKAIKRKRSKDTSRTRRKSTASLQLEEKDQPGSALQLLYSIVKMPRELRRLCFNHYLSWTAFVTILLFFTDYVEQVVFKGDPKADLGTPERNLYQEGVHMGCWGMCIFAFSAAISAVLYGRLVQFLSYRTLYVWTQVLFAVGTGCQAIYSDNEWVTLALCMTFGFMFTAIQSTPFSILSDFHKSDQYLKSSGKHQRGLGTDISCLTSMVFLSQITVSTILGPLVNVIGSHLTIVLFASIVAFMSSIVSAVFVVYEINDDKDEEETKDGRIGGGHSRYSESDDDEHTPLLR